MEIERLALQRWYQEESDVIAWRTFRDSPSGKRLFGFLYSNIPSNFPLRGDPVTDTQASIELGRVNGMIGTIQLLEMLCEFPQKPPDHLEADFQAEQILKEQ